MTNPHDSAREHPRNTADDTAPEFPPPPPPPVGGTNGTGAGLAAGMAPSSEQPEQAVQQIHQHPGSTNEPFAITMLIVLLVVGLGILAVLVLLLYRLFYG